MKRSIAIAAIAAAFLLALDGGAAAQMGGGRGSPTMSGAARGATTMQTAHCTIGSVGGGQFSCGGQSFRAGSPGMLRGLRSGMAATVRYHNSPSGPVADQVSGR